MAAILLPPLSLARTATASAIGAGWAHTCALTNAGAVLCWGNDFAGQLGDGGSNTNKSVPVAVSGLSSSVAATVAGGAHTCALTDLGSVKCWGFDAYGQLGDGGSDTAQSTPVAVSGLSSGVAAITAGGGHTCAVTNAGAALCWGWDYYGQLGDGGAPFTNTKQPSPVAVSGLSSGVAAIAAGENHTCALTNAGAVLCWGADSGGQVGDGVSLTEKSTPVAVNGLSSGVAAITAGGSHTCAVTNAGAALCWGWDYYGQLGDGGANTNTNKSTPVAVSGLSSDVSAIAAGTNHTCALTNAGAVKCWGRDDYGQLGDGGSDTDQSTPVAVSGLSSGVAAITAGEFHTCAVTNAGAALCWGADNFGQLGDGGADTDQSTPVAVSGFLGCGDGAVVGAEQCDLGALNGTAGSCCSSTCQILGPATECRAASGSCDLAEVCDGSSAVCPADGFATTGTSCRAAAGAFDEPESCSGTSGACPPDSIDAVAVSAGSNHTCALGTGGSVSCWGSNGYGEGTAPAGTFTAISLGATHTCALGADGSVSCWGSNFYGQADAPAGSFAAISSGGYHTCGLRTDSSVSCWGDNGSGRATPLAGSFSAISAGYDYTCALATGGGISCWGYDGHGQAAAPAGNFTAISAGGAHTCGLTASGSVSCWGDNRRGDAGAPDGNFTAISAGGAHTCGLTTSGSISCWGDNGHGQAAAPAGTFTAISAGFEYTCALATDGSVSCWGRNALGQATAPACGNGLTDGFEECDGSGTCCDACHLAAATTECRAAAGTCDIAETCTGAAAACPSDGKAIAGTICRASADACDVDETCDGGANACPADGVAPAEWNLVCRSSAGSCDLAESCDGTNTACPSDAKAENGTACGSATDDACTDADTCDGNGTCAPNHATSGTPCPTDSEVCTLDVCDGTGTCDHPAGNLGTECRAVSSVCDVAESCDGTSTACPSDAVQPDGTSCDDSDACSSGTVCTAGECDSGTTVVCGPCERCTDPGGCEVAPRDDCKQVIGECGSRMKIFDNVADVRDKVDWEWSSGERTTLEDFDDPASPASGSDYGLCLFADPAGTPSVLLAAEVAAGDGWKRLGSGGYRGLRWRGKGDATSGGLTSIDLRPGAAGKAYVRVQGKGEALQTPALPLSAAARLQLSASDGACWQATFNAGASTCSTIRNVDGLFYGKGE